MMGSYLIVLLPLLALTRSSAQWPAECSQRNLSISYRHGYDSDVCIEFLSGIPCATLDYLFQHVTDCANVRILDDQTLTNSINFGPSSHQLAIQGDNEMTTITCESNSGLFFNSSQQIRITNLHFINCSMEVANFLDSDSTEAIHPALTSSVTFYRSHDVSITDCAFSNAQGAALLLIDTDWAAVTGSVFRGAGHIAMDQSRSGGIVIRRLLDTVGNFSYTITRCNFSANLNLDIVSNNSCFFSEPQDNIGFGGAVDIKLLTQNSTTNISIEDSRFEFNRALYGGAVCMSYSGIGSRNLINFARSSFESNIACSHGGAISVRTDIDLEYHDQDSFGQILLDGCTFVNNSAFWGGGISVKRCRPCGDIVFSATHSTWAHNNAYSSGYAVAIGGNQTDTESRDRYAITILHVDVSFSDCTFVENTNSDYFQNNNAIGALALTSSELTISGALFDSNYGTALLLKSISRATFTGDVTFSNNFGINGGAIHLVAGSYIRLNSTANVLFEGNHAVVRGGAVYSQPISETFGQPAVRCLFQLEDEHNVENVSVRFDSNLASNVDQAVYVGNPGQCNHTILLYVFSYSPPTPNQIQTSADNIRFTTIPESVNNSLSVMLGEKFYLKPEVRDAFGQTSTSFGYLALLTTDGREHSETLNYALIGPNYLGIDNYTQNNQLFIQGPNNVSSFVLDFLYEQVSTYRSGSTQLKVEVIPCKIGYSYSQDTRKCECVNSRSLICHERSVCLQQGYWYDQEGKLTVPCPARNCDYANGECPQGTQECPRSPGYCGITHSNDICRKGRGNYLCSECTSDHAFNFGGFRCVSNKTCKPQNTIFIMLGVVAYWCLFIVGLLVILSLQLQVGSGFMFGVVYYFSVVTLFIDTIGTNPFLQVVADISISMTQLDPRIITEFLPICFAKDANALHHLMLRYVTPVFIISVIAAIILLSKHCRCPKRISLAENSPIHAICVLILFSYTSLSHTSFLILHPVVIGGKVNVEASPNTSYFDPKHHLPYALFALAIELFIALPICILLTAAPCLGRIPKVNFVKLRLKPVLDEFQACYHPKCRWFAGFYFLARQLMFLASIIPPQSNVILLCISAVILLVHTSFQPYKEKWLNILDTILLADILLLSVRASLAGTPMLESAGLNLFFYQAAPYILLLVPTCYLILVASSLLLKRIFNWLKGTQIYKHHRPSLSFPMVRLVSKKESQPSPEKSTQSNDPPSDEEREELLLVTHTEILPPHWNN